MKIKSVTVTSIILTIRDLLLGRRNITFHEGLVLIPTCFAIFVGVPFLLTAVAPVVLSPLANRPHNQVTSSTQTYRPDNNASTNPNAASTPSQYGAERARAREHYSAVARFRSKLNDFEYADQLFAGIEPGVTSGVINIQVTNFWFEFRSYQKRQLTAMITNMWQQEAGTSSVIVHIYDQTRHEVAGHSPISGVWIDDE